MYARISNVLAASANRTAATCITVTTSPLSSTKAELTAYRLSCGTLTTSTWPPASAPVIVTATSVILQHPCLASPLPSLAVVDATSAHPRHPLPMAMARSPMWYAATTRSHRGYAIGSSTPNFTTKSFAAVVDGDSSEVAASPNAQSMRAAEESNASRLGVAAPGAGTAESKVTGTVVLPDAMVFSFKGNPQEFQDRLQGAEVLVFFYKAVCGPCAAIRSKLFHAVTDRLPLDANTFIHGANGRRAAAHLGDEDVPQQQPGVGLVKEESSSVSSTTSAPSESTPPDTAESSMAVEDKEACALACRTLEDVSKAYPHRMIFLTVDTNENAKLTALHDIRSLPTFIAYRNGRIIGRVEGADEEEVKKLVRTITKANVEETPPQQKEGRSERGNEGEGKV